MKKFLLLTMLVGAGILLPALGSAACVDFNNGRLCVDVVYIGSSQYRLVSNVPNLYNTNAYPALRCEVTLPDGTKREESGCDMTFTYNGGGSEIKILMGFDKQVLYRGFAYRFADALATLGAPYIPSEQYNTSDSTIGGTAADPDWNGSVDGTIGNTNTSVNNNSTNTNTSTNTSNNTSNGGSVIVGGSTNTSVPIAGSTAGFSSTQYTTVKRIFDARPALMQSITNSYPRAKNNIQRETQQQTVYLNIIDILADAPGKSYTQYSTFVDQVVGLIQFARDL